MKSPPITESSGSSTSSRKAAPHPTGSGIRKSSAKTAKSRKAGQAIGGESPRKEKEWQAYFDTARDVSADNETVRAPRLEVLKEARSENEVDNCFSKDVGEDSRYDVKGLMAQIYQDLDDVAAAQASRAASRGGQSGRVSLGELNENDLLLREVSEGVTSVISKSLQPQSKSTVANSSIESALAYLYNPEHPQSSEIWTIEEKLARCLFHNDPAYERFLHLTAHPSWKFLSKLAHSATFRYAACTLDASTWQLVSASIEENAVSLMVFVECCGLEWWTELIRLNSLFPPSFEFSKYQPLKPKRPSPHKWVVAEKVEDVRRPTFEGKRQVNIRKNIYRGVAFQQSRRPSSWPADRPYPEDPTQVRKTSIMSCITYQSHTPYRCSFLTSPDIYYPLIELRDYGRKGVGVRALKPIPAKAILGEYVGEVFPGDYVGDLTYSLDFSLPRSRIDNVIATISAKRFGNWTRFINHLCDATTKFTNVTQGGRHRMIV